MNTPQTRSNNHLQILPIILSATCSLAASIYWFIIVNNAAPAANNSATDRTTATPELSPSDYLSASLGVIFNVGTIFWFSFLALQSLSSKESWDNFRNKTPCSKATTAISILGITFTSWQASDPYKDVALQLWPTLPALAYIEQALYTPSHFSGTQEVLKQIKQIASKSTEHWRIAGTCCTTAQHEKARKKLLADIQNKIINTTKLFIQEHEKRYCAKRSFTLPTIEQADPMQNLNQLIIQDLRPTNNLILSKKIIGMALTAIQTPLLTMSMLPFFIDSLGADWWSMLTATTSIAANMGLIINIARNSSSNLINCIFNKRLPVCIQLTPVSRSHLASYIMRCSTLIPLFTVAIPYLGYLTGESSQDLYEKNTQPYISNAELNATLIAMLRIGTTLFNIFGIGSILMTLLNATLSKNEPLHAFRKQTSLLLKQTPALLKSHPKDITKIFANHLTDSEARLLMNHTDRNTNTDTSSLYNSTVEQCKHDTSKQIISQIGPLMLAIGLSMAVNGASHTAQLTYRYLPFFILQLPFDTALKQLHSNCKARASLHQYSAQSMLYSLAAPLILANEDPRLQAQPSSLQPNLSDLEMQDNIAQNTSTTSTQSKWLVHAAKGILISGAGCLGELAAGLLLANLSLPISQSANQPINSVYN